MCNLHSLSSLYGPDMVPGLEALSSNLSSTRRVQTTKQPRTDCLASRVAVGVSYRIMEKAVHFHREFLQRGLHREPSVEEVADAVQSHGLQPEEIRQFNYRCAFEGDINCWRSMVRLGAFNRLAPIFGELIRGADRSTPCRRQPLAKFFRINSYDSS